MPRLVLAFSNSIIFVAEEFLISSSVITDIKEFVLLMSWIILDGVIKIISGLN